MTATSADAMSAGHADLHDHVGAIEGALGHLHAELPRLAAWGEAIAAHLCAGGRLLAAGNGGSAAQAQHLTSELVGRYVAERPALSAIALHADSSSYTAIVNDYGSESGFARQVCAHGRRDDFLVLLSTSGRSPNVVAAAEVAAQLGLTTLALTGPAPNPLASLADGALAIPAERTATVQEVHQVVIHLLCTAVDEAFGVVRTPAGEVR